MATEQEKGVETQGQVRNIREREAISNAYAALVGQQNIQSWSAFTFEEAMDAQIEEIEGKSTQKRPNLLERVDKIEQETVAAVAKLKEVPPEQFLEHNPATDVNTAEQEADDD